MTMAETRGMGLTGASVADLGTKRPHKHKEPRFGSKAQYNGDSRSDVLQDPHVHLVVRL